MGTSPSLLRLGPTVDGWRDNPPANPRWLRTTRSPSPSRCPRNWACRVDHGRGSRSQIRMSMEPRTIRAA